ncbi:EAL domain-containing protein [Sulfurimonas sp.]
MKNKTTYTKITAKIIFLALFFTLIGAYIYSSYMKRNAIINLSQVDAKKTSKLVFESLYSAMKRGWTKDDLNEIITRLNTIDSNMKVVVYRSELVANLFGEIKKDKEQREQNKLIKQAMTGKELLNIDNDDFIEYHYPVIAKNECLKCHVNVTSGDVLGVIGISYPIKDLKISLNKMINFFILFIVGFSLIIFIALFVKFNKYLIKPIKKFSSAIQNIINSNDMTKRVNTDDNIEEIASIKDVFNTMLDSIEYQFYYDALTNLQNRRKLTETLEKRQNSFLFIINIDSFREVNDLYGDQTGDLILKEFALLLQKIIPQKEMLYRLHSDEFAYLCQNGMNLHELDNFIMMILEKISQKSFQIGDNGQINISVTIGIAYGNSLLLANADIALKLAKKRKKNYLVYNESMEMAKEYEKNFTWSKRLKKAIENDKIVAVFQPIVNTKTQETSKYEALMRMQDDEGELIAPIYFLELAKKNKLYHQLTKIMIEKTFEKFKNLPYSVSINISVEDILNKEIYDFILEKLEKSKMGERIGFEILESEGIENFNQVLEFIEDVKKYGASISIDDFGTGYSNFEYLMKLKVDYIKIDGSMIKNIDTDKNSQMITQTIVEFAKKMQIKTIAEFVYSKNVFEKVAELDVDFVQGYYFGEPTQEIH